LFLDNYNLYLFFKYYLVTFFKKGILLVLHKYIDLHFSSFFIIKTNKNYQRSKMKRFQSGAEKRKKLKRIKK